MASKKVIHLDIRFDPDEWGFSNVICIRSEKHEAPVELAIVDFESLSKCDVYTHDAAQCYAISPWNLGMVATAHQVTVWQVLYAAYLWSTEPAQTLQTADPFVSELFASGEATVKDGDLLTSFRARMGDDAMGKLRDIWGRLSGPESGDSSAAAPLVQEAMGIIQQRFQAELGIAEF